MRVPSPSMPACLLMVTACLAWVGGISWAITHFFGLSVMTGWAVAGTLGFSTTTAITIILYEMRHAVEFEDLVKPVEVQTKPVTNPRAASIAASPRPGQVAPSFQVPNDFH